MIITTGKGWNVATHETVSCRALTDGPGLRGVSTQPDREGIEIDYDGKNCLTDYYEPLGNLISPAPFNTPFFILLTQGLGVGANAFNPNTTPLSATTEIDYVRVWQHP